MELFLDPKVMMMTEIASIPLASLGSFGVDLVQDSTKKHIWRTLEQEFGESLHIIQDNNGKLLVYPDSLMIQELVRENQSLKKKLKTLRMSMDEPQVQLCKAAKQLRADIKAKAKDEEQSWPPEVESVIPDVSPELL